MNKLIKLILVVLVFSLLGCEPLFDKVHKTQDGYLIDKGLSLVVVLDTSLSSNVNKRGDTFITRLKEGLIYKNDIVLPAGAQVTGLVKNADKFEQLGDKANLLLLFDQIVLPSGVTIPVSASLDTKEGATVIKVPGKAAQDLNIIGASGVVGSLVGKETLGQYGAEKGLAVGVISSANAVLISGRKEIKLPQGTELTIKLDEPVSIP